MFLRSNPTRKSTLRKIDFLAALLAGMGFVELIRENFDFFLTLGTFAGKGLQMFELFESGTMLRGRHDEPPILGEMGAILAT